MLSIIASSVKFKHFRFVEEDDTVVSFCYSEFSFLIVTSTTDPWYWKKPIESIVLKPLCVELWVATVASKVKC